MTGPFGTTPGPWRLVEDMRTDTHWYGDGDGPEYLAGYNIESDSGEIVGIEGIIPGGNAEENTRAIAQIPAMLALVEAAMFASDRNISSLRDMARDIARELEVK